jgi:uncharacterized protein RhaS with RHS repeats
VNGWAFRLDRARDQPFQPRSSPSTCDSRVNTSIPESGLAYNYYRDYDALIGFFVESDPIWLAGGINTYGYVM